MLLLAAHHADLGLPDRVVYDNMLACTDITVQ